MKIMNGRDEEVLLKKYAENLPGLIFRLTVDQNKIPHLSFLCKEAGNLLKIDPREIEHNPSRLYDLVLPEERAEIRELFRRSMRTGEKIERDIFASLPDGSNHWFRIEATHRKLPGGRGDEWFGAALDVTDIRKEKRELSESKELLEGIFSSVEDAIFLIGPGRSVVQSANAAVEYIFGYRPDELEGETTEILHLDRESFEEFGRLTRKSLEQKQSFHGEFQMRRRNGEVFPTEHSITVLNPESGWNGGVVSVVRDITERKKLEKELRDSEKRYRDLVENLNDVVYLVDREGRITYVTPPVQTVLGYTPDKLTGTVFFPLVHPEDKGRIGQEFERTITGERIVTEFRIRVGSGEYLWVRTSSVPVYDTGGIVGLQGVLTDISGRKQAEEEKANLEKQFHHAQKLESVGRLAGGVAHDFNNLLSPILGYSEMLMEEEADAESCRELSEEIYKAAGKAADLTRQLLAFGRKQTLEMEVLDMNEVLKGLEKLLRRTIREEIDIDLQLSSESLPVMADQGQVEQVIMNLAVNAQDAMPGKGTMTIETGLLDLDEESADVYHGINSGLYAMLAVRDTGTGMDRETLDQVFDPFFTTKAQDKGTGLGLATTYGIVKQHGGSIHPYSEPGRGSIFKVYLPICREACPTEKSLEMRENAPRGTETILVVEDDDNVRDLAARILESLGYKVLEAPDGEHALHSAKVYEGPIDLLLTDVVMPKMRGREVSEKLSAVRPELKVLFMSGYTDRNISRDQILDQGAHFIQKPFGKVQLAVKVREVLDDRIPPH